MPSGDAETCLTPCSVLRQRSWAQVCEMLLDPEGRWLTSAHRKKERHRQTQSNTHRHGQRDPQTERHSDRETWRHRRWYGFGALVGVLRALSCSKSRYFPPEALLGSFFPPPCPIPSPPSPARVPLGVRSRPDGLKAPGCQLRLPTDASPTPLLLVPGPPPQGTGSSPMLRGPAAHPNLSFPLCHCKVLWSLWQRTPQGPVGVSVDPCGCE